MFCKWATTLCLSFVFFISSAHADSVLTCGSLGQPKSSSELFTQGIRTTSIHSGSAIPNLVLPEVTMGLAQFGSYLLIENPDRVDLSASNLEPESQLFLLEAKRKLGIVQDKPVRIFSSSLIFSEHDEVLAYTINQQVALVSVIGVNAEHFACFKMTEQEQSSLQESLNAKLAAHAGEIKKLADADKTLRLQLAQLQAPLFPSFQKIIEATGIFSTDGQPLYGKAFNEPAQWAAAAAILGTGMAIISAMLTRSTAAAILLPTPDAGVTIDLKAIDMNAEQVAQFFTLNASEQKQICDKNAAYYKLCKALRDTERELKSAATISM